MPLKSSQTNLRSFVKVLNDCCCCCCCDDDDDDEDDDDDDDDVELNFSSSLFIEISMREFDARCSVRRESDKPPQLPSRSCMLFLEIDN